MIKGGVSVKKIFNIEFKKIFEKVNKEMVLFITGIVTMVLLVITMIVVTAVSTIPSDSDEKETYSFIGFTLEEKVSISKLIGDSIPFISTNEYYFETEENFIRFYTVGNDEDDFNAYQKSVINSGFKLASWDEEKGFGYEKGNSQVFLKSYKEEDKFIINVIITLKDGSSNGDNSGNDNGGNSGSGDSGNQGGDDNGGNTDNPTTSSIQNILNEAANLAVDGSLGERTATGTVKLIDEEYTSQYQNISFVLTDGTVEIVVHRAKGDCASVLKVGDTVTVTGEIINWQGTIEFKQPTLSNYVAGSGSNQGGNSGSGDSGNQGGTTEPTSSEIQEILDEAANLAVDASLGERTATGTVKSIDEAYTDQYKNISFVLTDGVAEILVHRATGDCAASLKVGDTVTVTGEIINWQGTIEFKQPTLSNYVAGSGSQGGNGGSGDSGNQGGNDDGGNTDNPTTSSIQNILNEAASLASGTSLSGDRTVTGTVKSIEEEYTTEYKKISFILTDGVAEILVHRATGDCAASLKVGDTVTVKGTVINYNGTVIEFQYPELSDYVAGSGSQGGNDDGGNSGSTQYANTDFTTSEKEIINDCFGFSIPFIPNNEYAFDEFVPETDGVIGIYYYAEINTQAEFDTYKTAILNSGFTFEGTEVDDEYGDTWYIYTKNDAYLITTCYLDEGSYWVEVQVYTEASDSGSGDSGNQGGTTTPTNSEVQSILDEAANLASGAYLSGNKEATGTVKSIDEEYTEQHKRISFILTDGVAEILVHRATGDCASILKVGDTVTVTGQITNYKGTIEFQYPELSNHVTGNGSNQGGSDVNEGELINNDGAGLPTDSDGVYDVDFTDAIYAKNVTELGNYIDGCPTEGDVKVLVIPVEFSDITASSKGYDINKINLAFNGTGNDTDYRSVSEYYFASSNGKLNLDFYVHNSWFKPANPSTYYASQVEYYEGYELFIGDQLVMDEALAELSKTLDLSEFDSDNNGCIDAVVFITTLEIDPSNEFNWAYRYWNFYIDENENYYEYDNVSANDYLWASYQFLYERENQQYDDEDAMNTYTFIHEFGHILGLEDYYDYSEKNNNPLDGADVMNFSAGDQNPFSKINLGWITTSRLVVADSSIQLTLKDFSSTGDTIIIANNWDSTLGAYQEYYILMYYTHTGLNEDGLYFENEGIVMYHVNASLEEYILENNPYYNIYNTNTDPSDEYGTEDNLIEFCKSTSNTYVHTTGTSSSANLVDDLGNKISYTFTVDSLTSTEATITFNKNN